MYAQITFTKNLSSKATPTEAPNGQPSAPMAFKRPAAPPAQASLPPTRPGPVNGKLSDGPKEEDKVIPTQEMPDADKAAAMMQALERLVVMITFWIHF